MALSPACTRKMAPVDDGTPAAPRLDVSSDRTAIRQSWLLALAKDASPLVSLAQSNEGWGRFFLGETEAARVAFEKAAANASPDDPVRIAWARAELELAAAHHGLGRVVALATPKLMAAQSNQGDPEMAAWRAYISARAASTLGEAPDAHLARIPQTTSAAAFRDAIKPGAPGSVAALLAGRADGVGAALPSGATSAYAERLNVRALFAAGQDAEALARWSAIDTKVADVSLGEGSDGLALWDPGLAGLGEVVHAVRAARALDKATGWGTFTRAQALLASGRAAVAVPVLEALIAAPPTDDPPLSLLVLGSALSRSDVILEARALLVQGWSALGDKPKAKAHLDALPSDSIAHRVLRAWAARHLDPSLDVEVFPADRAILVHAVTAELDELGKAAAGAADLAALGLVDRYVDSIERRFAELCSEGGRPELALKHLEAAEDKANSMTLSPRNRVSSLMAAASQNVRIGRPRVALKYLTRLSPHLPAVDGASEMLRDLLTLVAMDQEGGATTGQ